MGAILLTLALVTSAWAVEPARFRPADVGLAYPDSQAIRCDPRTGEPATQYVAMTRLEYLQGTIVPRVLRALRSVGQGGANGTVVRDQMRKFHLTYSLRPLCVGQPYAARANYLWDVPQGLFSRLQTALKGKSVRPDIHPDALEVAHLAVEAGRYVVRWPSGYTAKATCRRDPAVEAQGLLDGDLVLDQKLSPAVCQTLAATHGLHQAQAEAFLAGDIERAGVLGDQVREGHRKAVRETATPAEAQLVEMVFPGDVDPQAPRARTERLTRDLMAAHHAWVQALCAGVPDPFQVWLARAKHLWAHYRRAIDVGGGLLVFDVCTTASRVKGAIVCRPAHPDACPKVAF